MGRAFEYRRAAKEKRWDKMSRVFPKLAKKITIDAGLEAIEENDGMVYASADFTSFGEIAAALEKHNIDVKKANLRRFSNDPQEFSEEQMEEIEKMLDKLEEDDDVQAVYTNIA